MAEKRRGSKLSRIAECLKNKDYSNPELTGAKIISLCVILVLLIGLYILVVRVDGIEVKGDVDVFNESEVVNASGISVGGCLYLKPAFVIKNNIRKNLPMAQKISVIKNPFTRRVRIKVEFSDFEFFVQSGDKYYGVNRDLTVTYVSESGLEFISLGARTLTLPQIETPIVNEKIVFTQTLDILNEKGKIIKKGLDVSKFDYVTELLGFLADEKYMSRVNAVFLDEKFNIRVVMDEKYLVYIGRCESLKTKFEVVDAIIDEGSVAVGRGAVINVETPALASARVDNDLDLSAYVIESKNEEKSTDTPDKTPE